ncbi:MAG: sigma-70 family RNA polymerase sigma factor [Bryobacterales bacterium]|nr:sigma-70 family RNA polymerase sigma factor [Bryobacterales bacterium]
MAAEADSQLMLRVKDGDEPSFALLLHRFRVPVYRFLYRMVHNQALAEELAQEVFLRVYRARASYEPSAKFSTWLYRICTHLALNHLRDTRKERDHARLDETPESGRPLQVASKGATIEQKLVERDRVERIQRAVDELPEKQRVAVLMHKYQEMDYRQIAELLDTSESAVKSLLFRAYETLRGKLADLATTGATKAGS